MPSWPDGVTTCLVLFGKGITVAGNMTSARLDVTPVFQGTNTIVWETDGTPILPFTETVTASDGSYGSTSLPVVDQTGWLDDGQHPYTLWGYKLTETPSYGNLVGKPRVKYWQPVIGQTQVDFDRIPDGSLGLPASGPTAVVTSVNGQTGAVTIDVGTGGGGTVTDATTGAKGVIQLAGDLAGTASAPTVPGLAGKAPLDSPAFTGTPTIAGTAVAKTSDITTAITGLVNGASTALDTLAEIDAQIAADEGSAAALAALVAAKADAAAVAATYPTKVDVASGYAAGAEYPVSLPAGTALVHRYDPVRQTYNVTADTTRKWNAAKARMKNGGTAARVLAVGHSVVVGTSDLTPRWQYSFATKLRNLMNAKYGPAGTGLVYLVTTALSDDSRVVFTGTWAQALGTRGAFNAGCYNATGTGNTMTFTPDIPVDSFNVYYVKNTVSGTFSASVDGGAASTANANAAGTESIGVLTVPAGALGTHTLTITPPAGQAVYIVAVEGTVGTSGIRVSRAGRAGATTSTITTAGTAGVDSLSTIFSTQASPDLTVIMCEINDYNNAVPVSTFTANLTTIVQRAQATGDVLVIADETIMTQPNSGGVYQSAYHAAIYGLADSLGFGVLDIASRWRDYATSSPAVPGFYANATADPSGIHPSAVGHQDIANATFAVLGDGSTLTSSTTAASGVYLPEWQANTAYTVGQYVLNPSGQIVSANSSFTSGSTYSASNWTAVSTGGGGGTSLPSDASISGFNAWSYDIAATAAPSTLSNQRFNVVRMMASGGTISNLHVGVSTAAATPNAGVKMGIYDASGNLLGSTADIGSSLTTTGWKTFALTAPITVTAGQIIYVALWWSGTTGPGVARASSPTTVQNAFAIGAVRFGFITGQSALPASFTPASLSTETVDYWFAAS